MRADPVAANTATRVAALYVETGGVYYGLPDVDPWDEARDARLYAGPWPVVAHPPCNKWSPLAYINRKRIPGYEIGDDGGCFEAALRAVSEYGGVLEHPAHSLAWKHYDLARPRPGSWQLAWVSPSRSDFRGVYGWTTQVDQGSYGHRARKSTWLLYVGPEPPDLDWTPSESRVVVSGFLHHTGTDETRRVRPKEASKTPLAFRDVLLDMARSASKVAA